VRDVEGVEGAVDGEHGAFPVEGGEEGEVLSKNTQRRSQLLLKVVQKKDNLDIESVSSHVSRMRTEQVAIVRHPTFQHQNRLL